MRIIKITTATLMLSVPGLVLAQSHDTSWLLRGFGTLSATRTSDAGTGYVSYPQNIGRASSNQWSLENDSLLGLQVDWRPDDRLSATAQIVTRYRAQDRLQPALEWGFLKYRHDDHWTLQVGRLLTPVQMDAENRFVGFANTSVRTDLSAYSLYPLSNHDGVSITYERMVGDTQVEVLAYAGRASIELPGDADGRSTFDLRADLVRGVRLSVVRDRLTLRASYTAFDDHVEGDNTAFIKLLLAQARNGEANGCSTCGGAARALQNTLTDIGSTLIDIGFRYDSRPYAFWGEYFANTARTSLRTSYHGILLGASFTHGPWTPYITVGSQRLKKINAQRISTTELSNLGPDAGQLAWFNQEPIFPSNSARQSWSLGTRYELGPKSALKAEVLQVRLQDPSKAFPTPFPKLSPPSEPRQKSFGLYTLALDFVF